MGKKYPAGNGFSFLVGLIGIGINLIYFLYEYFIYKDGFINHFTALTIEHLVIVFLIPLFIVLGWLVGKKTQLQKELRLHSENLERMVRKRTAELEESNKLKELFSDILAHDLLNPLGSLKNALEMMLSESDDDLILIAKRNLNRTIELIENANKYSKIAGTDSLDLEEDDLTEILKKVVDDYGMAAKEKGIKMDFTPKGMSWSRVNPVIEDAFSNLLSNAIKYSPKNTVVSISIQNRDGWWKIGVKDQGGGIKDGDKKKIFERFRRIEKEGVKGTGLGLAIVKKAVELNKGRVWVEDNPQGGTVFYVELPKANSV